MKKSNTIFELSKPGMRGVAVPDCDVPKVDISTVVDIELLRTKAPHIPEVSEPEVVRHYVNLSTKNHHIDKGFYPLGSCTMKYNPKINEVLANLEGFRGLHPDQPDETCQGALKLLYELEDIMVKITGMSRFTFQPSAGAQGELAGALVMRKYHEKRNDNDRQYILIPDTAHGTNPATVTRAGYKARVVVSNNKGRVDLQDLESKLDSDVAGMMLTQPNTLGLFEYDIERISELVHSAGGLMYMDGANLNALIGISRSADMGFDITHINTHKTFSTPHGGGGPGSGPIGVVEKLVPYLPVPMVEKQSDGSYFWNYDYPDSIGSLHSYYGNFGVLVRAFVYVKMMGESGLKEMTKQAILNARYLKVLLEDKYDIPYSEGMMHEFVISGVKQKARGIKVLDIAKALLDEGFHSPTIYFPINIPEAMMIEPTETETKETLDRFANTMLEIDERIDTDPQSLQNAPVNTPVQRLDETLANRKPDVRWNFETTD